MKNLASVLIDLLCHITVEPEEGHDSDVTADIQMNSWQTLIHDLDEREKDIITKAVRAKLYELESHSSLTPEQEEIYQILSAYINGEMQ